MSLFDLNDFVFSMNEEKNRLKTFKDWPFREDCLCTPEKMAEAGFYHCPTDNEPDLVRCFVCLKELDGWEPEDDPWAEHVSHTTDCPFVKLNKKESEMSSSEFFKLEEQRWILFVKKETEAKVEEFRRFVEVAKDNMTGAFYKNNNGITKKMRTSRMM